MSVKGQIKEAAGYVKEEAYEHGKSAESQQKAQEGRYTLTPKGNGTHVEFELTVDPKAPLPGFLVKKGTKTILEAATEGLRQHVVG